MNILENIQMKAVIVNIDEEAKEVIGILKELLSRCEVLSLAVNGKKARIDDISAEDERVEIEACLENLGFRFGDICCTLKNREFYELMQKINDMHNGTYIFVLYPFSIIFNSNYEIFGDYIPNNIEWNELSDEEEFYTHDFPTMYVRADIEHWAELLDFDEYLPEEEIQDRIYGFNKNHLEKLVGWDLCRVMFEEDVEINQSYLNGIACQIEIPICDYWKEKVNKEKFEVFRENCGLIIDRMKQYGFDVCIRMAYAENMFRSVSDCKILKFDSDYNVISDATCCKIFENLT